MKYIFCGRDMYNFLECIKIRGIHKFLVFFQILFILTNIGVQSKENAETHQSKCSVMKEKSRDGINDQNVSRLSLHILRQLAPECMMIIIMICVQESVDNFEIAHVNMLSFGLSILSGLKCQNTNYVPRFDT